MPEELIRKISQPIVDRLRSRSDVFAMFKALDTGPEEWFRVEILEAVWQLKELNVESTNQVYKNYSGRPDFVFCFGGVEKIVELKVLPVDRNYNSSYQRFCAGKTNKADFDALSKGEIALVIYVHWPSVKDFEKTKGSLEKRYSVSCQSAEVITAGGIDVTISFWCQKNA